MTLVRHALAAITLAIACTILGCGQSTETGPSRPAAFGYQRTPGEALVAEGQVAYGKHCAGCHGVEGNGKGEAARFLHPKPRNFQIANFKFSSTRSGRLPTDADLERTIRYGLKGSAMPPWDLLPDRTVTALIAYIKTFSPKWQQRRPAPPIPFFEDPYRSLDDKTEAIRRGELVYHGFATCWTCHPAYVPTERINEHLVAMENPSRERFRDGLFQADPKLNAEGELIYPPDFRRDFVRAGTDVTDLYRSIGAGITGTAMPTWIDSMEFPSSSGDRPLVQPSDIWAIAYYVQDLLKQRPAKLAEGVFDARDRQQVIYLTGEPPEPATEAVEEQEEFSDEEEFEEFEEFEEED